MASVSFSAIRSRFATAVDAISGFSASRNPADSHYRVPQSVAHLRFWIVLGSSEGLPEDRQNMPPGVISETGVAVRFAYRLRPKDQITDYDLALDTIETVIETIDTRGAPLHTDLQIRYERMGIELVPSGEFVICTVFFNVLHVISL